MNRREFLKGLGFVLAGLFVPRVPEPTRYDIVEDPSLATVGEPGPWYVDVGAVVDCEAFHHTDEYLPDGSTIFNECTPKPQLNFWDYMDDATDELEKYSPSEKEPPQYLDLETFDDELAAQFLDWYASEDRKGHFVLPGDYEQHLMQNAQGDPPIWRLWSERCANALHASYFVTSWDSDV